MNNRHTLAQIRAQLDELPVAERDAADPQAQYDQIESVAIAILTASPAELIEGDLATGQHAQTDRDR